MTNLKDDSKTTANPDVWLWQESWKPNAPNSSWRTNVNVANMTVKDENTYSNAKNQESGHGETWRQLGEKATGKQSIATSSLIQGHLETPVSVTAKCLWILGSSDKGMRLSKLGNSNPKTDSIPQ